MKRPEWATAIYEKRKGNPHNGYPDDPVEYYDQCISKYSDKDGMKFLPSQIEFLSKWYDTVENELASDDKRITEERVMLYLANEKLGKHLIMASELISSLIEKIEPQWGDEHELIIKAKEILKEIRK